MCRRADSSYPLKREASFALDFGGFSRATGGSYASAAVLVLGVFTGSALWWLLLSSAVNLLRGRFSIGGMRWANRLSGLILLAFGLAALLSARP